MIKMLLIQGIDYNKCNNCGKCMQACTARLFFKTDDKDKKYVFKNPHDVCIKCGHCIAICPVEAILFEHKDLAFNFEGTKKLSEIVSYEDLMKILRMRRSMRVYKDEPIAEKILGKMLEAMRYAPTASNRQNWRLTVVTNKEDIAYLSKESTKDLFLARKILPLRYLALPFLSPGLRKRAIDPRTKVILDRELGEVEKGKDIVFFNAPCVIILYARPYASDIAANDAGVVMTHGMLAAQALGLGTVWVGIAQRIFKKKRIKKYFKIPRGYKVYGVLAVGVPNLTYQRAPPRRELRIHRMD